ncbi:condensation domain-containing protein [Microtetraspora niveoalba]|uniref:condensation domain-containing protein n=1 Tax=Microtetraspora niveoalba TaxID=46175 RepID=UPI00082D3221|nr:condensation domain-containing protein [Microtetraspora niveoalba]
MTTPDRREALRRRLADLPPDRREALLRSLGGRRDAEAAGRAWPLSPGQERLWFLSRFDPGDTGYHTPWCVRLRGSLDADALGAAFTRIAERHEVLRTRFRMVADTPAQIVLPPSPVPVEWITVPEDGAAEGAAVKDPVSEDPISEGPVSEDPVSEGPVSEGAVGEGVDRALAAFVNRPFDLENGPPLRAGLIRLGEDDALLCIVLHHIVVDGWSLDVLMRELAECYAARREGREPELEELPTQYPRHAARERARDHTAHLAYWTERLAGAPALGLPADRPRPPRWTGNGGREHLLLPPEDVAPLERLARETRCTSFMALLAAYQAMLGGAAGQHDFCVGVPVAGRSASELAPLIGYFGNTLALRADLSGDPTFRELLLRVREVTLSAMRHADAPFEAVLAALRVPRDISRPPLCQAMFNLHNLPKGDLLRTSMGDLDAEHHPAPPTARTKAEISVDVWRGPEGLGGVLDYSGDLFTPATARRLADAFAHVVRLAGAEPDRRLSELS